MRITKLTDYGIVIMAFIATQPMRLFQAREISDYTSISLPTVSKLLKNLTKNKLLTSQRGTSGGYLLARSPNEITVAQLIRALEGPIALTECNLGHDHCPTETLCAVRTPWLTINKVIIEALEGVSLFELSNPKYPNTPKPFIGIKHVSFG